MSRIVARSSSLLLILALAAGLYIINIGKTGLNGKDEFRYAEIAKEILTSGDWLILHINGSPYPDKPPVFFWTIAVSYMLNGGEFTPFGARLPLALFALGCVVVTFFTARHLFDNRIALLSSLALMVSFRFYWGARWLRLDIPLCFFVYLSLLFFVKFYFSKPESAPQESAQPHHSLLFPLLFWISMALATLVKGPIGIVTPLGSILTFLVLKRSVRDIRLTKPLPGAVLFIVIVAAWLIPALLLAPKTYSEDLLLTQNVTRVVAPWRHIKPPYYFAGKLFADFQPWVFFAIAAIWFILKHRRELPEYPKLLFLLSWFLFPFVLLSIVPGKRGQYLLPLYPALAILVAWFFQRAVYERSRPRREAGLPIPRSYFMVPALVLAGACLLTGAAVQWFWSRTSVYMAPVLGSGGALTLSAALILFGLLLLFFAFRRRWRSYLVALFLGVYASLAVLSIGVFPSIYSNTDLVALAREIESRRAPEAKVYCLDKVEPQYIFYGDYYVTPVKKLRGMFTALRDTTQPDFAILEGNDFEKLKRDLDFSKVPYETIFEGTVEWERIVAIQRLQDRDYSD